MADTAVAEEIRKRRTAAALLNGGDDDSEEEDTTDASAADVPTTDADTAALAEEEAIDQGAIDQEVPAPTGKAQNLGYKFVPVSPPTQDVPQNVPRGTFLGEEGLDVSAALTSAPVYSTPIEEGNQQYIIDQISGAKVPRAQLASSEDIAAQPPPKGAVQFPQEVVTGQVPQVEPAPDKLEQVERAELVKPPAEAPGQLTQVERAQLIKVPPGTAPRAVAIGSPPAVKPAEPAAPSTKFLGEEGVDVVPTPPKVQRALGYKFVPIAPAAPSTARALPSGAAQPIQKPLPTQAAYPNLADAAEANVGRLSTKTMPGTAGGSLGCAGGVCKIVRDEMGYSIPQTLSTAELYNELKDSGWKEVAPSTPGAVIVSPTRGGQHGHTGIVGYDGKIYSNSSATGDWEQNYTVDGWARYFGGRGLETHAFLPPRQLGDAAPAVKPAAPAVKPAEQADVTTFRNPNGSELPSRVQAIGNNDPAAFIVHHTSGRGTVDGVVSTLKERGLGVQYVMDRDGNIFQTGGPGAQNILKGWGKGEGLSNQNIVGMEIIAKDDKDVTDAQKQSFARFIAARYPTTPLYGHGEVNPGHKEADEGLSAKAAALAYRDQLSKGGAPAQVAGQPGAAPQAQPVTKQANGLYQNEKPQDFLSGRATTFATQEDIASGADNGVGAPRLGRLDTTSVAGVAIPEEALRAKYGNNYAAWRRARVDVVDPQTGKRLRVPIVDVGPRGDLTAIVDMTSTLSSYFGGDKNLMVKLVDNAGPDVVKNPQLFEDEQAAIKQGVDSSALQPEVQKIHPKLGYSFKPIDPARNTALQQGFVQASKDAIAQLPEQNQSLPALINRLDHSIKGVPDAMRLNYQKQIKAEATKYAQDYYGIQDPKAAYTKMMSSPDAGTFFSEIKDKVGPYFNQAVTAFNQSAVTIDQNRLDMLAKAIHPEASPEARKTFINSITSEPDDVKRTIMINSLIGNLANENPNNPALAALNAGDIADSARRMADPEYQKRQKEEIDRQVAQNMRDLRPDPRLQGTAAGWWADQLAQLPKNIVEGITGPVGDSLMISEIYKGTMDRLRQENPGMSEDDLKAKIGGSSATQVIAMMVLNRLSGGKLGTMVGQIENPVARIGASALMHAGIGGTIGTAQQAVTNIAEGKPITEGLLQAAGAGAVQAAPGAILGGIHGRAPVAEERPQVAGERPPVTEPVRPPVEPVRPVEEAAPAPAIPVTQEDVARRAYEIYDERTKNGQPGTALDDWAQAKEELGATAASGEPVLPASMGDSEPITSAIANRYRDQRITQGELGPVEAAQGQSTEEQVAKGLRMSPKQREILINNMVAGKGGNLDLQMSALRAKELYLSEASKAASRDAMAEPTNAAKQQAAQDALAALTDFHNGPLKEGKRIWSDAGRGLQQEIPVDYTTLNGLKEAYLKFQGKSAPDTLDPALSGMAKKAQEVANNERVAAKGLADEIDKYIAGSKLSTDEQVRAELAAIMKNLPCPT